MLRRVLVEATLTHVRYAANSDITKFYNRLAKNRGKSKAKVAAASRCCGFFLRFGSTGASRLNAI